MAAGDMVAHGAPHEGSARSCEDAQKAHHRGLGCCCPAAPSYSNQVRLTAPT